MIQYKGYYIKPHKLFPSSFVIATEGKGGSIPSIMEGAFTSPKLAQNLIDRYLERDITVKRKPYASKAATKSGD